MKDELNTTLLQKKSPNKREEGHNLTLVKLLLDDSFDIKFLNMPSINNKVGLLLSLALCWLVFVSYGRVLIRQDAFVPERIKEGERVSCFLAF